MTTPQSTLEEILHELVEYFQSVEHFDTKAALEEDQQVINEAKQAIRAWAVSQLPEKKLYNPEHENQFELSEFDGFNRAIDQATQSLREGK